MSMQGLDHAIWWELQVLKWKSAGTHWWNPHYGWGVCVKDGHHGLSVNLGDNTPIIRVIGDQLPLKLDYAAVVAEHGKLTHETQTAWAKSLARQIDERTKQGQNNDH